MPGADHLGNGVIHATVAESVPFWEAPPRPAPGAPNIVLVVLDDVGFAHLGSYGSSISTPTTDRLASNGLRFSNFHVTALCSSTRASLLTGRNHHTVGMATVANWDTGYPAGRGRITAAAATLAEVLQMAGYNTFAVGKWHLTPGEETSSLGPYRDWPLGRGFDRFYGFLGAWVNHWSPQLWYDNHRVAVPIGDDYYLTDDLVDHGIGFVRDHIGVDRGKPFFLYLATGACHAPLHAPASAIAHYRNAFDIGWDQYRMETLARQIAVGLVPSDTQLAARNPGVPAWEDLALENQQAYAAWNEVFAGMLHHTDTQLGRLVTYFENHGLLEDTIFLVMSDNGASSEGGPNGSRNYLGSRAGVQAPSPADGPPDPEELGGPSSLGIYPEGWAQAGNTPLKWYKTYTYGGGVRAPLIVHWPGGGVIPGIVPAFVHVTDIVPTLLEAAELTAPTSFKGVEQIPLHGTSFLGLLRGQEQAKTPHRTQYFETFGHRGIWHNGWKAVTLHQRGESYENDRWELYQLSTDFPECSDLATDHPELLDVLIQLWWAEAERNNVLPLDDRGGALGGVVSPYSIRTRRTFLYEPGMASVPSAIAPDLVNRSYTIAATVVSSGDGVLLAQGGRFGGYSLFVRNGHVCFAYNNASHEQLLESEHQLPPEGGTVRFRFTRTGDFEGTGEICINDNSDGPRPFKETLRSMNVSFEGLECGRDDLTAVSARYETPFCFEGVLDHVVVEIDAEGGSQIGDQIEALTTEQ